MSQPAPDLADLPDEDLMMLVVNGIVAASVAELYARHQRGLFAFIVWRCNNPALAADVCQRTWEKLMQAAHYAPTARFRTFLFGIAQNVLTDARRRTREEPAADAGLALVDEAASPEAQLGQQEENAQLARALAALSGAQREAVALRFFGELSVAEIAQLTQTGEETVKSRLRYAFAHLRHLLEKP
jgi:RNA polymerase sigma-70 factor (ECF subfamily)